MQEFDNEDLIRDFEEFDEKLPSVAKVIVQRRIDFSLLTEEDDGEEQTLEEFEACHAVFQSVSAILREMVECTSEMTADEFEHYIHILLTACELVELVNGGLAYEKEEGKFVLTPEGESYCRELESCED